jgi:chaperonin GroES
MATKLSTKFSPLSDRVVVRVSEEGEQKRGSLFIPDTAREKPQQGEVLAVGPGRYEFGHLVPMGVKVGDRVLYSKYGGTDHEIDGEKVLIIAEKDIHAILG